LRINILAARVSFLIIILCRSHAIIIPINYQLMRVFNKCKLAHIKTIRLPKRSAVQSKLDNSNVTICGWGKTSDGEYLKVCVFRRKIQM